MVFWEGVMKEEQSRPMTPLTTYFSVIRDPQIERNKRYPLREGIVITILALIAMARGREDEASLTGEVSEFGTRDTPS
jgi:hypothetical protein